MTRLLLAGLLAVVSVAGASAQDYPNRPIIKAAGIKQQ